MKNDGHRERHELLHKNLDELIADWIRHNPGKIPSTSTIMDLMNWSHKQTLNPTEL
jgi:hypothetical protein